MNIDIKLTANTKSVLQNEENNDLTAMAASWDMGIDIVINNPFNITNEVISFSEFPCNH
jgi:hypothetical protein